MIPLPPLPRLMMCACLLLALAGEALAADTSKPSTLDEVLVTARGIPSPASKTPGSVGVVTAEDIRETGSVSVADALARIPGVTKTGDSPWGADINIRGLGRDQVVVLIDGVRVNTTTDINGRLGVVNQNDIERVEVLKGPISALYGSGSIGGVVNIITKKGRFTKNPEWHGEGSLTGSTNPQGPDAYANLSYSSDDFWMLGSGGWREGASYFDGRGVKTKNTRFEDWQGKLAGAFKWSEAHSTMLQYQSMDGSQIGVPGGNSKGLPVNADVTLRENDRRMLQLVHTWTPKGMALTESSLDLSWQLLTRYPRIDNYTSGTVAWQQPSGTHETLNGRWKNVFALGDHTLVAGAEASNWDMRSRAEVMSTAGVLTYAMPVPDSSQLTAGVFAEDDWKLAPAWTLNLGGRADSVHITNGGGTPVSGSGGEKNDANWGAHAGLTYAFSDPWSASLMAATSYRTPNILELYKRIALGGGAFEVGDPNLKSEETRFFELSLKRSGESLRLNSAVFANFIDNFITKESTGGGNYKMVNIGAATLMGLEQSVEWDFATGWMAYANAAYTYGRDETHATWLPFVAPLSGLVGVKQTIGPWWWAVESQWAAEQTNTPSETHNSQAWAILNVRAGYKMDAAGLRHEFTLGVNNLTNESYTNYLTTARGNVYREPGTNAYMNYHVSF
ncbi:TonB-dependent receptor [Humidesulfovibrio sp.]|uniref:TonB-dependent receptor n=1 Tax=Humidesulfovibrio sp. TaxID=2910988 RepID=UPI00280BC2C5|nr:TonB-dependent receptor [Humidesulfovibrio sp.]